MDKQKAFRRSLVLAIFTMAVLAGTAAGIAVLAQPGPWITILLLTGAVVIEMIAVLASSSDVAEFMAQCWLDQHCGSGKNQRSGAPDGITAIFPVLIWPLVALADQAKERLNLPIRGPGETLQRALRIAITLERMQRGLGQRTNRVHQIRAEWERMQHDIRINFVPQAHDFIQQAYNAQMTIERALPAQEKFQNLLPLNFKNLQHSLLVYAVQHEKVFQSYRRIAGKARRLSAQLLDADVYYVEYVEKRKERREKLRQVFANITARRASLNAHPAVQAIAGWQEGRQQMAEYREAAKQANDAQVEFSGILQYHVTQMLQANDRIAQYDGLEFTCADPAKRLTVSAVRRKMD